MAGQPQEKAAAKEPVEAPEDQQPREPAETLEPEAPLVTRLKQQAPRDLWAQKQLGLVALAFIVAFAVLVYVPSVKTLSELHERISAGSQQLQSNLERGRALPDLRTRAQRLQQELEAFKPLPDERSVPGIINETVGFGSLYQLRAFHQAQQEPVFDGTLGIWPVRLTFEGNFENVYGFLRRCEQMSSPVAVGELSIKQKPAVTGTAIQAGEVMVTMVLNVYFRPEPMAIAQ